MARERAIGWLPNELERRVVQDWSPSAEPQIPILGEVRGKIVVLQNFDAAQIYGLAWKNLDIQDDYNLTSNWGLYDKWTSVKNQLNKANISSKKQIVVNFLSGSGGSFPYFVASGKSSPQTHAPRLLTGRTTPGWHSYPDFPRVGCRIGICSIAFEGTNNLVTAELAKEKLKFTGIVMIDFPGAGLISRIIKLNQVQ